MFKITTATVATLDVSGLSDPPDPDGFSASIANSYFCEAGLDVSLTWIDAALHSRMLQQHRDNLEQPTLVTVQRIEQIMLGQIAVTEVVYHKARPVVDPADPERIMDGREVTWQYIWPVDDGQTHALLTLWRSGPRDAPELEQGFAEMRDRWHAAPALPGTVYALTSRQASDVLDLRALAIKAPALSWGEIAVPAFHQHHGWRVRVSPVTGSGVVMTEPLTLEILHPGQFDDVEAEMAQVEAWLDRWSPLFARFGAVLNDAACTFCQHLANAAGVGAVQATLTLVDAWMDFDQPDQLRLILQVCIHDGATQEGGCVVGPDGALSDCTLE